MFFRGKRYFLLILLIVFCCQPSKAIKFSFIEEKPTQKAEKLLQKGASDKAFKVLQHAPGIYDQEITQWLESRASSLDPMFLALLAEKKAAYNQQDAIRWFSISKVRALYDVSRCQDRSAGSFLPVMYGVVAPHAAQQVEKNPEMLASVGDSVLAWDNEHPNLAEPTWLCSTFIPKQDWPALRTRQHEAFAQYFHSLQKQANPAKHSLE